MTPAESYIIFKGVRSSDIGVVLREEPVITSPLMRITEQTEIPGRDGKLISTDGAYGPVTVKLKMATLRGADMSTVREWLSGSGDLIIGDDPTKCRKGAVITKEVTITPVKRMGRAELEASFQCDPFLEDATGVILHPEIGGETTVYNPSTLPAMPIFKVSTGTYSGTITLTAADGTETTLRVSAGATGVYVDCETGYAYTGSAAGGDPFDVPVKTIAPDMAGGDLIRIGPGKSVITVNDQVTSIAMKPRWRWF